MITIDAAGLCPRANAAWGMPLRLCGVWFITKWSSSIDFFVTCPADSKNCRINYSATTVYISVVMLATTAIYYTDCIAVYSLTVTSLCSMLHIPGIELT